MHIVICTYDMHTFVDRSIHEKISRHLENFKCVALLGARQTGKSTLAKIILQSHPGSIYLDLEDPVDFAKLMIHLLF